MLLRNIFTVGFYVMCGVAAFQSYRRAVKAAERCPCFEVFFRTTSNTTSLEDDLSARCDATPDVTIRVESAGEPTSASTPNFAVLREPAKENKCASPSNFFNMLWRTRFGYKCLSNELCKAAAFLFIRATLITLLAFAPMPPEVSGGMLFGLAMFDYDLKTFTPSFNMINMILMGAILCAALALQTMKRPTVFDAFSSASKKKQGAARGSNGQFVKNQKQPKQQIVERYVV